MQGRSSSGEFERIVKGRSYGREEWSSTRWAQKDMEEGEMK